MIDSPKEDRIRVLVIDDEEGIRTSLARLLRQREMDVTTAENGRAGLLLLERERFDVVLVDMRMPVVPGPEFIERSRAAGHDVEIVVMTAFADLAVLHALEICGDCRLLMKPFDSNASVADAVAHAAQARRERTGRC